MVDAVSNNLHMKVTWGGQIPNVMDDEDVTYGIRPSAKGRWLVVIRFDTPDFGGMLLEDEDGSALCWNDFVVNEWVELYSDTPTALMRLALLLNATERDAFFVNNHLGFAKFAREFMEESAVADFPKAGTV